MSDTSDLKKVLLFSRLSDQVLSEVGAALEARPLASGEVLFKQGDSGDELLIVRQGGVAIFVPSQDKPGAERPIRIFGPGEALGEMALIDRRPRSVSARAVEASQVSVLSGDDFRRLLRELPELALAVMGGLSDRIRYTTDFLAEVQAWVKRVAEGKYDQSFEPGAGYEDRSITALAGDFAQMAAQVKKREEELRQEVMQLRIEIDEAKKQKQVGEIVESEYFQSLKAQVAELRKKK
ncbi:MAG: cyclic nucleotide-binding domain-containing protein [Thermoflexales bacterium]|nr:cyclic nucleotide-binding domain-containing protein [Thermoflexales bacterium]